MIVVRSVMQAKYGRGGELVALLKEVQQHPSGVKYAPSRILTDASGRFFTVVTETETSSLAEYERMIGEMFSLPEFGEWFARMIPLVESGSREFFNVES
ncbi:MAG: hypothetical protein HYY30_02735 [Chloroflexi bacterium]|nr:hypothetical protein [Chloroflexota bacterium]